MVGDDGGVGHTIVFGNVCFIASPRRENARNMWKECCAGKAETRPIPANSRVAANKIWTLWAGVEDMTIVLR